MDKPAAPSSITVAAALLLALSCTGCAAIRAVDDLASVDTYAQCALADTVTTAAGLATHRMAEANPITNALAIKAFGKVIGTVIPVVGLSIAGYYLLKAIDEPAVTTAASGLTCFSAARNLWIVR